MTEKKVTVKVLRFDPGVDKEPYFKDYEVPVCEGLSVMGALDYIYENLDGSLSYYDHSACAQGICKTCLAKINGKPALMCQTLVEEDVCVEPLDKFVIVKDLVTQKGARK